MIERRDEELSHIYRDAEGPRPAQRVDDNILAASQRVAGTVRRPAALEFARRWGAPVALTATVLVTSTLALMVFERRSGVDVLARKAPREERPAKVAAPLRPSPAEPQRTEPSEKSRVAEQPRAEALAKSPVAGQARADSPQKSPSVALSHPAPAKSPSVALSYTAPAPTAPSPPAASRSDRVKQPTVETALSGERRATGQPARMPAIPPGVEILRKSEEAKPAPAAAPPAAQARAAGASPQTPVPDAQRVFDAQQQNRAMQAPPVAAPAAAANSLRESAAALQGAASGLTSRVAVSEAKERTPEKWLEDIRKLKTEGKTTEVERELGEFKKRYPDYILPEDLR